jgi:hypothetical protein
MSKINAKKLARLLAASKKTPQEAFRRDADHGQSSRRPGDHSRPGKTSHLPAEVRVHVHADGQKTLCLRWLSTKGCDGLSNDPSVCMYDSRVHQVPKSLHPSLRKFINENLGGLKPEYSHL